MLFSVPDGLFDHLVSVQNNLAQESHLVRPSRSLPIVLVWYIGSGVLERLFEPFSRVLRQELLSLSTDPTTAMLWMPKLNYAISNTMRMSFTCSLVGEDLSRLSIHWTLTTRSGNRLFMMLSTVTSYSHVRFLRAYRIYSGANLSTMIHPVLT